jgi:hypothetical protein
MLAFMRLSSDRWLWCLSGHACRRHIVARWLIDFQGLMLTADKTLIAMCPRRPYS